MLGVGWSPGTNAPGFLAHVLSLLAVASPSRRCCCAALAPTIAAVAVTLPSRRRSAIAVASSLRFRRRSPRVRALCSPVLPRRPCRLPLASRPCRQSRRSRRCCPGGRSRAYAPCAVLVSLLGRPWLRTPLSVIVGIVVGASVGVLVAGGGGDVIILGSSVIDALLTPVRRVAFVARVRIAADAAAARPDGRSRRICLSLVCRAAIVARARRPANGRLRASRPECGMGSISHFSSRWPKQSQYSDSSPPRAHMASS